MSITLQAFKKANKEARERIAKKNGYVNAASMLAVLLVNGGSIGIDLNAKGNKEAQGRTRIFKKKGGGGAGKQAPVALKTVHNVHILDASTSMNNGGKIKAALQGINEETRFLKEDRTVNYTNTLISFSGSFDCKTHTYMTPIAQATDVDIRTRGMTALHDAIGITLTRLRTSKKYDEKVLVKIFTDGGENDSKSWNGDRVKALIAELETEGFTIVFVGTTQDTATAITQYNLHASNTMSHDNTSRGITESFRTSNSATLSYSKKVAKGQDVKVGFFKQVGKL